MINRGSYRFWLIALIHLKMINPGSYRFCLRDDIKLCHWFPKFPFLSLLINFDIKIVWNMKIGCGSWGPPLCRHLPTTTIGIISTLQNFRTKNNIPDMLKKPPKVKVSLMSWFRDLWWSSTIFWMNMTESCLFVNWRQFYDEYPSYDKFFIIWCVSCPSNGKKLMMDVHHMMGIHHTLRVLFLFCNQRSKVYLLF